MDRKDVAQRMADSVRALLDARVAAVYGHEAGRLVPLAVSGDGVALLGDPSLDRGTDAGASVEQTPHGARVRVPLVVDGEITGLLTIGHASSHAFAGTSLRVVEAIGAHVALALEAAYRYDTETERRRLATESLAAISRLITQSLDADEVGQRIVDSVRVLLGASRATLTRFEPESGALHLIAISGDEAFPLGTGIAGLAIHERRSIVTADLLAEPRLALSPEVRAHCERLDVRAVVSVPLMVGETVIGALSIGDHAGRVFDGEEVRLLEACADQAAIAIRNADLHAETERQRQEAVALDEVARRITGSLDREEVFQRIVEQARDLCRSDVAALAPYDPVGEVAAIVAAAGEGADTLVALRFRRGRGAGGRVLETGEPFVTDDYVHDPRITSEYVEFAALRGLVALAVVPLRFDGVIRGFLSVGNRVRQPFSAQDLAVLTKLADHAAIALENSRLYAGAQELAVSRERVRMSAGLHDTLSQMLFSIALKLEWCLGRVTPEVRARIEEVKRETGVMMGHLRQLIYQLSSAPDTGGTHAARLRHLVEQFHELTGIPVDFVESGDLERLRDEEREVLHRTIQEALANIAKHSGATRASVRLEMGAEGLVFEVADNGDGSADRREGYLEAGPGHLGLRLMLGRVEALGGRLEFGQTFPVGFYVRGRLPTA